MLETKARVFSFDERVTVPKIRSAVGVSGKSEELWF